MIKYEFQKGKIYVNKYVDNKIVATYKRYNYKRCYVTFEEINDELVKLDVYLCYNVDNENEHIILKSVGNNLLDCTEELKHEFLW